MKNDPINSVYAYDIADYLSWAENCETQFGLENTTLNTWFRGQSDERWPLTPSLYRGHINPRFEREMLRDFRANSLEHLEYRERNAIDWLFISQHYGLPTRLLDWTENALVALYFGCQNDENNKDGCITALNAWALNIATIDMRSVPPTDAESFQEYVIDVSNNKFPREVEAKLPMAVRPFHRFRRSNAQSGMFTIHGKDRTPLNDLDFKGQNPASCMTTINVAADRKLEILKSLNRIGINEGSLFQSVDAISRAVSFRYSKFWIN